MSYFFNLKAIETKDKEARVMVIDLSEFVSLVAVYCVPSPFGFKLVVNNVYCILRFFCHRPKRVRLNLVGDLGPIVFAPVLFLYKSSINKKSVLVN